MLIFIYKQFFASFFLFTKINITIVFRKIFAIFVIKVCNLVVLIILNYLKFNKDNLNIKSRSRNNKKEVFLKILHSYFFFAFFLY